MKSRLHQLLGIELFEADAVHGRIGYKANVVVLGHGMIERDAPIVLNALDGKGVFRIRLFGLLGKHRGTAAAKAAFPERMYHVSADRTNIKHAFEHVARAIGISPNVTSQKLGHAYTEPLGQRLNEGNVGETTAGLPLTDSFIGHAKAFRQGALSEAALFTQPFDGRRGQKSLGDIALRCLVHGMSNQIEEMERPGSKASIHLKIVLDNLRCVDMHRPNERGFLDIQITSVDNLPL